MRLGEKRGEVSGGASTGGYGRNGKEGEHMKKDKRPHAIIFRLTKEDTDELEMDSYLADMSKSEYIRRAIHVYCNLRKYAPDVLEAYERGVCEK